MIQQNEKRYEKIALEINSIWGGDRVAVWMYAEVIYLVTSIGLYYQISEREYKFEFSSVELDDLIYDL